MLIFYVEIEYPVSEKKISWILMCTVLAVVLGIMACFIIGPGLILFDKTAQEISRKF